MMIAMADATAYNFFPNRLFDVAQAVDLFVGGDVDNSTEANNLRKLFFI